MHALRDFFVVKPGDGLFVGFLMYAFLPAFTHISPLVAALCLLPFLFRARLYLQPRIRGAMVVLVLLGWCLFTQFETQRWLSGDTFLTGLMVALSLKWSESFSIKEKKALSVAAVMMMALSSVYLSGLASLAYLLAGLFLLVWILLDLGAMPALGLSPRLMMSARIIAAALPITAVLFVTVPRIQGPLWDLGIVMGLPIKLFVDPDKRLQGVKSQLQAGSVSRAKKSDEPVLVAEFEGVVPYKSQLYWRGPVYDQFDGEQWQLREGWDNRSELIDNSFKSRAQLDDVLTQTNNLVRYQARITPNNTRYLFGLDLPVGGSPETFISNDFQVLGIRRVDREFNYDQQAFLEYHGGRPLSEEERQRYLQYPENSNPELYRFGQQIARDHSEESARIHALQVHFASGGYQLTETADDDDTLDDLDGYLLDRKSSTIESLASSAALILRAANIPTRLVYGYRGGKLIALTNFVVVRQEHAHVWVEAWLEGSGWQRVEAMDFVAPPEPEDRPEGARQQPEKSQDSSDLAKPKQQQNLAAQQEPQTSQQSSSQKKKDDKDKSGLGWLSRLANSLDAWVVNYNPDRQIELMKKSGLVQIDWKVLFMTSLFAVLVVMSLYGVFFNRRRNHNQDGLALAFAKLNLAMQKKGYQCLPQECPSTWLRRLEVTAPQIYPAMHVVIQRYIELRYGIEELTAKQLHQLNRDIKRLAGML